MTTSSTPPLDLPQTQAWAMRFAADLPPHCVIGLVGTLGAGKTTMAQTMAASIGIDPANVTSPTFTLMQRHVGQRPMNQPGGGEEQVMHHLDAYRLADEDEFLELGVDELFEEPTSGWVVVEWADQVESVMPPGTIWVRIEINADETRTVQVSR